MHGVCKRPGWSVNGTNEKRRGEGRILERSGIEDSGYRLLFDAVADGVMLTAADGTILDVNPEACALLERSHEEVVTAGRDTVFDASDPRLVAALEEQTRTGRFKGELRLLRQDGTSFPAEVSFAAYRGEFGDDKVVIVFRDISERKEAEKKFREAETRFRTLVEQIPAVTYMEDVDDEDRSTDLLYASPQITAMFGYSPEEWMADPQLFPKLLHPDDRERVLAEDERTDETGEPFRVEYRQFTRDGRVIWVRDEAVLVMDENGRPRYWLGVLHDTTDQKRSEEELKESEERYKTFIEQSTEGIWRFELETPLPTDLPEDEQLERLYRDAYLAECNDAMARMYGHERAEEIVGAKPADLLPRSVPVNDEYLRAAVRSGYRLVDFESQVIDAEGNVRYRSNNLSGVIEDGILLRAWGTQRDITESKEAERRIKEAENRFRALVERIPAVTYIEDVDRGEAPTTDFLYISPQIESMFGYSPEEWMADPDFFVKHLHPEDRERVLAEDERTEVTGEPFRVEYRQFARDGRVIWVRDEAVLIHDEAGVPLYWLGVQLDITDRKEAEEELAARAEDLRRSNAELEQFAYVASHDLQEPLRMVASYTQLLARRYRGRLDPDADEFISYAIDGVERMQVLINDLLEYSRVGTRGRELTAVESGAALEAALANLRVAIEEGGARVEVAGELPRVKGDETQLVQLFQNLIANAIKFGGEGPVEVGVGASRRGGEWMFWVKDDGIGIEGQYAERIFKIFQRLHGKGEYAGTGIGLAVCKKIVERHGGRIWAESEGLGKGATFYFTLPALDKGP